MKSRVIFSESGTGNNRPPKDESGNYIFAVRRQCNGSGCDEYFKTKDPAQRHCRNCRRKKDVKDVEL